MKKLCLILVVLLPLALAAQVIPASMRVDWSRAGNISFAVPSTVVSINDFGGSGNGTSDNSAAFAAALASLGVQPGIIRFGAGTYLFNSPVTLTDSIILEGIAPGESKLLFHLGGSPVHCINISRNQSSAFVAATGGFTKGSDSLILASVQNISAGDIIELRQDNGAWDTDPASWAAHSVGQLVKVNSVNGNKLYLEEEIRIDYSQSLQPEVRKIDPVRNAGLKCLEIARADAASFGYNVYFNYAYNCRIEGIESSRSAGAHIGVEASSRIVVSGSYIHHSFAYDGSGTKGYGVMLAAHSGDCLVENNIFRQLRHAMMVKQGANGNVFAYNYSIEPVRTEAPSNAGGDISLHGHYAFANLFEGNIVQNIHIDQAWGPSGPHNTFFRNRAELYGIIMTQGSVQSDRQNFVGNEVTHSNYGFYIMAGSGHTQHANNVKGTITPAGTSQLNESSYYLTSMPQWWSLAQWPTIGPPLAAGSGRIPAKARFTTGAFTSCSQPSTVPVHDPTVSDIKIYPNPAPANTAITLEASAQVIEIALTDLTGRVVFVAKLESTPHLSSIALPGLNTGVYMLELSTRDGAIRSKLVVSD